MSENPSTTLQRVVLLVDTDNFAKWERALKSKLLAQKALLFPTASDMCLYQRGDFPSVADFKSCFVDGDKQTSKAPARGYV
jgi:hypothetical protein